MTYPTADLTLNGYQERAMRTGAASRGEAALSLAGMGLAGEAGEVCDLLKKVVHHGRPLDEAMRAKLVEECAAAEAAVRRDEGGRGRRLVAAARVGGLELRLLGVVLVGARVAGEVGVEGAVVGGAPVGERGHRGHLLPRSYARPAGWLLSSHSKRCATNNCE